MHEYRHKCALCGGDRPHLHHIDEDPTNNDPQNLLPLCPNCHLVDQHDPTAKVDPAKLSLFRRFKSPAILDERFHPLWLRCAFLRDSQSLSTERLERAADELVRFVRQLEMGEFYGPGLGVLIGRPSSGGAWLLDESPQKLAQRRSEHRLEYLEKLGANRDAVMELIVELLRYQNWLPQHQPQHPRPRGGL